MPVYEPPELPFELSAMAMVRLGPKYARLLTLGKKGASDVIHITPLGHAELGRRLRDHARAQKRGS